MARILTSAALLACISLESVGAFAPPMITSRQSVISLRCSASPESSVDRRDMISLMGVAVASGLANCITPRAAYAADGPKKVNAQGPAQALDMIIIMKAAKAFREIGPKIEAGDFKAVNGVLTNTWSSNTVAFIRKNKVLESLSTSIKGTAAGQDLESDPAFTNAPSPESQQVEAVAEGFYKAADAMKAAADGKDIEGLKTAYKASVVALDEVLTALGLPVVADADPKLIKTP